VIVVSDSGPLIHLASVRHFSLLKRFFHTLHTVPQVYEKWSPDAKTFPPCRLSHDHVVGQEERCLTRDCASDDRRIRLGYVRGDESLDQGGIGRGAYQ
jgi:hypothetical protein